MHQNKVHHVLQPLGMKFVVLRQHPAWPTAEKLLLLGTLRGVRNQTLEFCMEHTLQPVRLFPKPRNSKYSYVYWSLRSSEVVIQSFKNMWLWSSEKRKIITLGGGGHKSFQEAFFNKFKQGMFRTVWCVRDSTGARALACMWLIVVWSLTSYIQLPTHSTSDWSIAPELGLSTIWCDYPLQNNVTNYLVKT